LCCARRVSDTQAVALKPAVLLQVLRLGFDALFLDVDVALSGDPRPWVQRSPAELQVSLNYDDRPGQQVVTRVPDLNTGVVFARSSPTTRALVDLWMSRTRDRVGCPKRGLLWACGDQEQLTRLLKQCRWQPLTFEAAAALEHANDRQLIDCAAVGGVERLHVEVLPPRLFASGQSAALWRQHGGSHLRPGVVPADVLTFHPNFLGFGSGAKKTRLSTLRFQSTGASAWCAADSTRLSAAWHPKTPISISGK